MWPFGPSDSESTSNDAAKDSTREETYDPALHELARSIQEAITSKPSTSATTQVVPPTPAVGGFVPPLNVPKHDQLGDGRRVYEDGTIDITPEKMHPKSMSCRQAFDQAFYCHSLGGKFKDVYRFGELRSCNEQWGAFWFCMRTRTLDDGEKARQMTKFYQDRDTKRKEEHGSSEDVWDIRTRSVREAFGKDPDTIDISQKQQA